MRLMLHAISDRRSSTNILPTIASPDEAFE